MSLRALTSGSVLRRLGRWLSGAAVFSFAFLSSTITFADWVPGEGFRRLPLSITKTGAVGFETLAPQRSGIQFTNQLSPSLSITNQIYLNGSGLACGDVDGNGLVDVYFCGLGSNNALFLNQGGLRFEEAADRCGVECAGLFSTGAVLADMNGDHHLDLLVNTVGDGVKVFKNDGFGVFTDVSRSMPAPKGRGGMSLAVGDVNGDGQLDVYSANYRVTTFRDMPDTRFRLRMVNGQAKVMMVNGRPTTDPDLVGRYTADSSGQIFEHGQVDDLYFNIGDFSFRRVPFTGGLFLDESGKPLSSDLFDWGLSVMFRDINQDGLADIYVCNDFAEPDRIWLNQGQGFRLMPKLSLRHIARFSMGIDFADFNRDGLDDFFVVDMLSRQHARRQMQISHAKPEPTAPGEIDNRPQYVRNALMLNRGNGTYSDTANRAGVSATEWSWTPVFMDVDLDGFEDLLISNGFERDANNTDIVRELERIKASSKLSTFARLKLRERFPRLSTANLAFRNNQEARFEERTEEWGFGLYGVSQGMALADLDNDGDQDVLINNLNDVATVLINQTDAPRVAVRLRGANSNSNGVGARIELRNPQLVQSQEIISGGRYLSSDDAMRVFAAPVDSGPYELKVRWPGGSVSTLENIIPNQIYEVDQARSSRFEKGREQAKLALFENVSERLDHGHTDQAFDDFARQATMPFRLGFLGPGVSWSDINGDDWPDLIIGTGRGGRISAFQNNQGRGFLALRMPSLNRPMARDVLGLIGQPTSAGFSLMAALSNYEDGMATGMSLVEFREQARRPEVILSNIQSSLACLAQADVDGDGDLDLFVGGRCIPGRFPEAAESYLLLNANGKLEVADGSGQRFAQLGMVTGASFGDINSDGFPDLIVARDWSSIKVFMNDGRGRFEDVSDSMGVSSWRGLWRGVAVGDFDSDGRLDFVAGNVGSNTSLTDYGATELRLAYGPFRGSSAPLSTVLGYRKNENEAWKPVEALDLLAQVIPDLRSRYGSYSTFSRALLKEILNPYHKHVVAYDINAFETTLFLNQGDFFKPTALPWMAQLAPVFGIGVSDFDMDGLLDLYLGQNEFGVHPDRERVDSGLGLLLLGQALGKFKALEPAVSGIEIFGEQRGLAVGDFDRDGRPDLAVSQNGSQTQLLRNASDSRGVEIGFDLGGSNPNGIGVQVRFRFGEHWGPLQEVVSGSGYLSQNQPRLFSGELNGQRPVGVEVLPVGGQRRYLEWPSGCRRARLKADFELIQE